MIADKRNFKPIREEILNKAWKKEWDDLPKAVGSDGELVPSFEEFKRTKLSTKFIPKEL